MGNTGHVTCTGRGPVAGCVMVRDPGNIVFLREESVDHQFVLFCLIPSNKVAEVVE